MKKRALVAGGAGFIGSHLCDTLLEKGYEVTAVDCLVTGRRKNLETALAKGLTLIEHDINEPLPEALEEQRFDEIYNLASPASPVDFKRMPVFILETAAIGHRRLLDFARETKARILYASTSEVYGDPDVHPQPETYFGNVNPIGPRGCYDEAKRFGEALTYAYHRFHGVDVRVARIFNTYGPRMRPDDGRIIPNFFIQALQGKPLSVYGEGRQTRSFCYVSDLVEGLYLLMQSDERLPVNLGNPVEKTVISIAKTINELVGKNAPIAHHPFPENDPRQRCPDIARARKTLGWEPKVPLDRGLAACLAYFQEELALANGSIETPTLS